MKNWFGLYCPNCEKVIPCLTSISSLLVLVLTFPLWIGFKGRLKERWLAVQAGRFQDLQKQYRNDPYGERRCLYNNSWSIGFFVVAPVLLLALMQEGFSWSRLVITLMTTAMIGFALFSGQKLSDVD